jgi:hypothetical protein
MFKQYLKSIEKNNYSKNTINTYRSILTIHKNDFNDVRNLKSSIKKHFNSPNTA